MISITISLICKIVLKIATQLTKEQRNAAIKHYYQSGKNRAEANRRFANQFGIPPSQGRNITCLVRKSEETGFVADIQSGRPSTATTLEKENELTKAINLK